MSSISPAVAAVLQARQDATNQQIDIALLGKQLDVQQAVGDSINQLLKESVDIQKQLAAGHIDVRV